MIENTRRKQMGFVILTSLIYLLGYAVFVFSNNVFQYDITSLHLDVHLFPHLGMTATVITMGVLLLCFLERFQNLNYQFTLISALVLVLMLIPVTIDTFPVISGFSNAVYNLTEPWRQLYVPPAIRATMEGITTGVTGMLSVRSVRLESYWAIELVRYRYAVVIIGIGMIVFWWLKESLKNSELKEALTQKPETSLRLVVKYPYIFIICFISGLDQGLFNYSYFLGQEILPAATISSFQYIIYISSIISPILIGRLADKYGIFLMILSASILLTGCKWVNSAMAFMQVTTPIYYLVITGLEAGLTSCLWMLSASLIGERLRTKGIFRSFALSNIAFASGLFFCGIVYNYFSGHFAWTKFWMGIVNAVLIATFSWLYVKREKNEVC